MKRIAAFLTTLAMLLCTSCSIAFAGEEDAALPVPGGMPEHYLGYTAVPGVETNGVTFVITRAHYHGHMLAISVLQLPNDGYTALIDNQVEDTEDTSQRDSEAALASQYGDTVIGTLCDISSITDEDGNIPYSGYGVASQRRDGASLLTTFTIFFPQDSTCEEVNVTFAFGVNEDLNYRFPAPGSLRLTYSISEQTATVQP